MTLTGYFTLKSVFGQQSCHALSFALARLSCLVRCRSDDVDVSSNQPRAGVSRSVLRHLSDSARRRRVRRQVLQSTTSTQRTHALRSVLSSLIQLLYMTLLPAVHWTHVYTRSLYFNLI